MLHARWRVGAAPRRYAPDCPVRLPGKPGQTVMSVRIRSGEADIEATMRLLQLLLNAYVIERKQDMISIVETEGAAPGHKVVKAIIDARIREIRNMTTCIHVTITPTKDTPVTFPQPAPECLEVVSVIGEYSKIWADFEARVGKSGFPPLWEGDKERVLETMVVESKTTDKVPTLKHLASQYLLDWLTLPYDPKKAACPLRQSPAWHAAHSYVSGGNLQGVLQVLEQTKRERMKPSVMTEHLTTAFFDLLMQYRADKVQLEPSPIDENIARTSGYEGTKAAGYIPCEERRIELEDEIIQFSWTASKENSIHVVMAQFQKLAEKIRDVLAGSTKGTVSECFWPNLFAKIAIKSEVRNANVDRLKVRAFFVVAMLRGMVDKLIYEPAFKAMYDRGPVGIGFQKDHGGMHELFEDMHGRRKGWFYVESDFSKYDQSMMASMLTIVFMVPLFFYKSYEGSARVTRYAMLRETMVWAADSIACSLVKWSGTEARLIVGIMFSGLFGTSWGGTVYAILVRKCFDYWTYERLIEGGYDARAAAWKATIQPYKQYGDDQLMAFREEFYDLITGVAFDKRSPHDKPRVLMNYFRDEFGITLKEEETHVYVGKMVEHQGRPVYHFPLLTILEEKRLKYHFVANEDDPVEPGCVKWVSPRLAHLGVYEWAGQWIVHNGPKYLQRRCVAVRREGKISVVYWRVPEDYYARASRTASENVTLQSYTEMRLGMYLLKWRGMMYDVGANVEAYRFLRFIHDLIVKEYPGALLSLDKWERIINDQFRGVVGPAEEEVFRMSMKDVLERLTSDGRWRYGNITEQCPSFVDVEEHMFDNEFGEFDYDRKYKRTAFEEYWEIWRGRHPLSGEQVPLPGDYDRYLAQYN